MLVELLLVVYIVVHLHHGRNNGLFFTYDQWLMKGHSFLFCALSRMSLHFLVYSIGSISISCLTLCCMLRLGTGLDD